MRSRFNLRQGTGTARFILQSIFDVGVYGAFSGGLSGSSVEELSLALETACEAI